MAYWIYVTTSENWKVTREIKILGVARRHKNTLALTTKGDRCLIYVKQETVNKEVIQSKIVAEYEIISDTFVDEKKIFVTPRGMGNEKFDLRLRLKPLRIFKNPILFKPLIPKLSFIRNKEKWSLRLKGKAMIQIPPADYKLITSGNT